MGVKEEDACVYRNSNNASTGETGGGAMGTATGDSEEDACGYRNSNSAGKSKRIKGRMSRKCEKRRRMHASTEIQITLRRVKPVVEPWALRPVTRKRMHVCTAVSRVDRGGKWRSIMAERENNGLRSRRQCVW